MQTRDAVRSAQFQNESRPAFAGLHRVTLASAAPEHAASIAPVKSNICANAQEEHPIAAPKQKVLKFLSLVGVSDLRLISDSIGVRMDK
jgi:hypothetical protein